MTDATLSFFCSDRESFWVSVLISGGVKFDEFVYPFLKGGACSLDVFLAGLHGEKLSFMMLGSSISSGRGDNIRPADFYLVNVGIHTCFSLGCCCTRHHHHLIGQASTLNVLLAIHNKGKSKLKI
eukprot:scaffold3014_cov111-Skeletonema_dohrnii-CCMP3373.AAC.4